MQEGIPSHLYAASKGMGCKIDMRVTIPAKKHFGLGVVEDARKLTLSKYYKGKVQSVLFSAIYHQDYQKKTIIAKHVLSMLIAHLENEILLYYYILTRNGALGKRLKVLKSPQMSKQLEKVTSRTISIDQALEGISFCILHKLSMSHHEFIYTSRI